MDKFLAINIRIDSFLHIADVYTYVEDDDTISTIMMLFSNIYDFAKNLGCVVISENRLHYYNLKSNEVCISMSFMFKNKCDLDKFIQKIKYFI